MAEDRAASSKGSSLWRGLLAVLVCLAVGGPLLFGLPVPGYLSGSDGNFALDLTRGYMGSFHAGVWFPRWLPASNDGLGSPVFYFYGRLPFLIAAVLGLGLHLRPADALLAGFVFFRTLAFFTCRAWLRLHSPSRAADCGALAFIALPFAMSLNPVTRVGFAETAATAFLPLLFLALEGIIVGRQRAAVVAQLGLTYAVLACIHPPQLLLAAGITLLYAAARRSVPAVLANLLGLGLGLVLAAASVLPALQLHSTISTSAWSDSSYLELRNNLLFTSARFKLYGLYALDLELYSTWILCAAVVGLLCFWKRFRLRGDGGRRRALTIVLVLVLLAMTGVAAPFWLSISPLRIIQFPWRLFPGALALTAAAVASLVADRRRRQHLCLVLGGALAILQIALAGAGAYLSRTAGESTVQLPQEVLRALPAYVAHAQRDLPRNAAMRSSVPEYIPAEARLAGWHIGPGQDHLVPGLRGDKIVALPPGLEATARPDGALLITGTLRSARSVVLPVFFFPDEAVSGNPTIAVQPDKPTGLARVDLPAGHVALALTHTRPIRVVREDEWVSGFGAVLLCAVLLFAWREAAGSIAAGRFEIFRPAVVRAVARRRFTTAVP